MLAILRSIFWLGVGMLFVPFLGIPDSWKMIISTVVGILLIISALQLREEYKVLRKQKIQE